MPSKRKKNKIVKKKKATNKKTNEKPRYIGSVVIAMLEKDSNVKNLDIVTEVKKYFPDSAFNKLHASYYRSRFKQKLLPKQKGYVKPNKAVKKKTKKSSKKSSKKNTSKKKIGKKKKAVRKNKKAA